MSVIAIARAALALSLAGAPALASAASGETWATAAAPNGGYSVDTPCDAAEIAALAGVPDGLTLPFLPQSRVMCRKNGVMFLSGQTEITELPAGKSLFDMIVEQGKNDPTAEGTPTIATIDGKRAFLNRQDEKGRLAQTGLIEVSRTKVVFMVAGVDEGSALSVKQQGDLIDRFSTSFKVTGK